jgi:thiol-disulfide isomerase/thioredoxin
VAVLAAAGTVAGCSSGTGGSSSVGSVEVAPGIAQINPADRTAAPQLSGTTIAGQPYSTSYQGHITVINVWGSWCTACREEAPSFSEAAKKYASKDVRFLGIDTLDNDASAQSYDSRFGITYPSLTDPDQLLVLDLKALVPSEPPSTLIVDRSGKVAVRAIGGITEPELDQDLDYVLSGSD